MAKLVDIPKLINELNQTDEHHRIEAKTASQLGRSAMETVVAFANEPRLDGGFILLGVKRRKGTAPSTYDVVGVPDPDKASADFSSQCASMLNRRVRPRVETSHVNGKPVIGVYVPEARASEKPVFIKSDGLPEGAYRRIGSTDQQCTEDDLHVFYQEQESYDASVPPDTERDDIDPAAVEDYRKTRASVNPEAEELKWDDEDLLRALNCLGTDRAGTLRPTVAGVLLFGSKMALRRLFPLARIDYMRVPGTEWMEDPTRRFINSIEIRAPLMTAIRRAQAAVLDDLPKSFSLPEGSLQRIDEPRIPLDALREAIVNAVMHRDYRRYSAIQIIRYANRVEVRNPGYSLVAKDRLDAPDSETRNRQIANVLNDTRFAETKGTGIGVMRREMREAGLSPPEFETNRRANRFVTTLYLHHFLDPDNIDWLARFKELHLSEAEVRGLVHARETGRISNAVYREMNGIRDTLKASQDLRRLREAGLLDMKDKGTATYYVPTDRLLNPPAGPNVPSLFDETSEAEERIPQAERQTSGVGSETSGIAGGMSGAEGETSGIAGGMSGAETVEASVLPAPLQQRVKDVRGKNVPRAKLRNLICDLCAWRPLSASEVAQLVGKNRDYIANRYMVPLVEAGCLERTIPEKPTHRNQKYRAADSDK